MIILPLAAPVLRPPAKAAIEGGVLAYQGAAELIEGIGDLLPKLSPKPSGRPARRRWKGRCRPQVSRGGSAVEVRAGRGLDKRFDFVLTGGEGVGRYLRRG